MNDSAFEVWLLDVSGSMHGRRIELLRQAVAKYGQESPGPRRLICFATTIREVEGADQIPTPNGGTNLHLALERAAELMAAQVVVFTDGEPNDAEACYTAAAKIPGIVQTVFCGDSGDREAIRFLEKLARDNGGQSVTRDVLKGQSLLCGEVRELLGLPAPVAL